MGVQLDNLRSLYDSYVMDPVFSSLRSRGANFVAGRGPLNPSIMIIGDKPGPDEDDQGKPFIGKAGVELDILLRGSNIDPHDVFFTCVLKYESPIYKDSIKAKSYEYVQKEVDIVQPTVVGLASLNVIQMFYPDIQELAPFNGKLIDGKYVPVYSPSAIIHNFSKRQLIRKGYDSLRQHAHFLNLAS